ncbi:hypothetical protein JCM19235_6799 [Vibrio maritimus]|uniref:Uncharacterized protein n=1 Tax=Vibrio maritimus TaxID=990268 RepID=A0A090RSH5_9VIBR|nr:hypothetical protein JCM19235_6799 [Vibrio maritimus]
MCEKTSNITRPEQSKAKQRSAHSLATTNKPSSIKHIFDHDRF